MSKKADVDQQEEREASVVYNRARELVRNPRKGAFDVTHLRAIHAYLFQDLPHHRPGVIRSDTSDSWIKNRVLEGQSVAYSVHYAHRDIETQISKALSDFGGSATLKGLEPQDAARRLAKVYGDLDYAHGFYEGNSRTLREFTRSLAAEAGHTLDWIGTGVSAKERNALYIARDVAVLERAFPDLTDARALKTTDRDEYEASFVIAGLKRTMGAQSLEAIITRNLMRSVARENADDTTREQRPRGCENFMGQRPNPEGPRVMDTMTDLAVGQIMREAMERGNWDEVKAALEDPLNKTPASTEAASWTPEAYEAAFAARVAEIEAEQQPNEKDNSNDRGGGRSR